MHASRPMEICCTVRLGKDSRSNSTPHRTGARNQGRWVRPAPAFWAFLLPASWRFQPISNSKDLSPRECWRVLRLAVVLRAKLLTAWNMPIGPLTARAWRLYDVWAGKTGSNIRWERCSTKLLDGSAILDFLQTERRLHSLTILSSAMTPVQSPPW